MKEIDSGMHGYINNLYSRERLKTRIVQLGDVPMGGNFPIRIQSMTNTPTTDTDATVNQARELFEAGCDYVRITARNLTEAKNLAIIKKHLHMDGFRNPLIADIHFNPEVALVAARVVEKVRINPGNYTDNSDVRIDRIKMKEDEYNAELDRISARLMPLIDICKEYGTVIRIGTNHGSLSKRILERYGNTPEGMVQSALEFTRIISAFGFHNLVLSMKASNIRVMVYAYRLLVKRMHEEGFDYPLHLGVTEAGSGEEGIIKSAAGIGALLADGIGDTLRVSLTGDPVTEVPVAKKLAVAFDQEKNRVLPSEFKVAYDPFGYTRRKTKNAGVIGGDKPIAVIVNNHSAGGQSDMFFSRSVPEKKNIGLGNITIVPSAIWNEEIINIVPYFTSIDSYNKTYRRSNLMNLVEVNCEGLTIKIINDIIKDDSMVLVVRCDHDHPVGCLRYMFHKLKVHHCAAPVILKSIIQGNGDIPFLHSAAYLSALLVDGYGDAIWLDAENDNSADEARAFSLLQAIGLRRVKAEFVSCPTCGRTTYNIEKVLKEIQYLTVHLKHLKIAVMGCIVNGPGEMADADYGCVGSGRGKVAIYKGKDIILKNVSESDAARQLLQLIRKSGDDKFT